MERISGKPEEIFKRYLRRFLLEEVSKKEKKILRKDEIQENLFRRLGELGYLGIAVPEEFGGGGGGFQTLSWFFEELASVSPGLSASLLSHIGLYITAIAEFASYDQKKRLLPPALRGEEIGALAVTEEEAGSDVFSIRTRAEKVKGGFELFGSKAFICNFSRSERVIILARDEDGKFSFYIAQKGEGFFEGSKLEKLGLEGSDTGNFYLDGLFVPEDMVLGKRGDGIKILSGILRLSRILTAANCVGLAKGALEGAKSFARERVQFGKSIRDFQAVRLSLSRMEVDVEIGRTLYAKASLLKDKGLLKDMDSIVCKIYCSEMANRVTDMAVHLMGAYGYSKEFGVEKFLRASRAYTVGEGTTEIMLEQVSKLKNI